MLTRHVAIALGAVIGAALRVSVGWLAAPFVPAGVPLGTLLVNLVGCLLIGIAQTLFLDLIRVRPEVQAFVTVGLLGGLTTFSSVSVETIHMIEQGALGLALGYQLLSLSGGIAAVLLGMALARRGHRWAQRRRAA
jgi:CrcB protein